MIFITARFRIRPEDAGLAPHDAPRHPDRERDPAEARRDEPAEVGRAVPVGGREREPGDEGDGRADQPQPVEREAPADHGVWRSSARRWIVIGVRPVAMSTS